MSKRQANSNSTKIILIAFSILQKRGDVNLPYIIRLKFIQINGYSSIVVFLGKLKKLLVKIGTKNIATVKTEIPISAAWLPRNLLKADSG